jgi:subtilisin family serine protease
MLRNTSNRWTLLLLVAALLAPAALLAQDGGDGRYIVKFRDGAQGRAALHAAGARVVLDLAPQGAAAAHIPAQALQGLRHNPSIEYIEEDVRRYPMAETVPYGIPMVQANLVSDASAANRKVCIIDSGYYLDHEDLQNSGVTSSPDSGTGDPFTDLCGHGTHVAGTIAALTNTVGVLGVLPGGNVNLHIVKVFGDDCVWAYSSNLIAALNACRNAGSNVVSMSLGGSFKSRTEDNAFKDAYAAGVLSIAAAGNAGNTQVSYPAGYASVISVAAIDSNKALAAFSQRNSDVELAAPGVGVLSTVPYLENNTLSAGGTTWNGGRIEGAARTTGTSAPLFGTTGDQCTATSGSYAGRIVLCQRGTISFAEKVANVENSGGAGVAVYNNVASDPSCAVFLGTLGDGVTSGIPAISLSCADGAAALTQSGSNSTVVSTFQQPASGYDFFNGTSMATPHVSGVAALVWSHNTGWTNQQVRDAMNATAEDLGTAGRDNSFGFGLVQAKAALDFLLGGGGPTCKAAGESCTANSDCCSNSCKGPAGGKTCK